MATVIERIAHWAATEHAFSLLAMERARHAFVDTIACIVAGGGDAATLSVIDACKDASSGPGRAPFVGGGLATPSVAALINGTAAHALDYDDNFHPARAHASAVLIPALLASASTRPGTIMRDLLEAYLVGLQAQAMVGWGVNPSHYNAGWHGTSTVGCLGSVAGVARILGLGADGIASSISLAASFASGPKGQFGTPAKPMHAGIAARNAVDSVFLARSGMTGRLDILEGPQGFLELFGGSSPRGWAELPLGGPLAVESSGLVAKRHPCCGSTHRAIDAVLDLQAEHGFAAQDVASIHVTLGVAAFRNLAYPDPADEMQARFSMQYCVAVALMHGRLRLEDFTAAAIRRPQIRKLMPIIRMTPYTEQEEEGVDRLPHVIQLSLRDGRTLRQVRMHAKGSSQFPFTDDDRKEKFLDCCVRTLPQEVVAKLARMLDHPDGMENVGNIAALAFGSKGRLSDQPS